MAKGSQVVDMPSPKPEVNFYFGKSNPIQGVDKLTINQEVTLIVKGKVSRISQSDYESSLSVKDISVKIDNGNLKRPM